MGRGVPTLKERREREILIYGLLQLSSLIYHAVRLHTAIAPLQEACLPHHESSHSSSCLGNKLCTPLRPLASPLNLSPPAMQSHSYTHNCAPRQDYSQFTGSEMWQDLIIVNKNLLSCFQSLNLIEINCGLFMRSVALLFLILDYFVITNRTTGNSHF